MIEGEPKVDNYIFICTAIMLGCSTLRLTGCLRTNEVREKITVLLGFYWFNVLVSILNCLYMYLLYPRVQIFSLVQATECDSPPLGTKATRPGNCLSPLNQYLFVILVVSDLCVRC